MFGELLTKIIYEFRHLLALLIVVLFAVALFAAMWPGMMKGDVALIKDGLQAVAAALGGLIGSIIGYYFGESAASKAPRLGGSGVPAPAAEQQAPSDGNAGITVPAKPSIEGKQE